MQGRVAPGEAGSIACLPLSQVCQHGSSRWGYFIRPGIMLRCSYRMKLTSRQDMRAIDDAYRAVVLRLLLP